MNKISVSELMIKASVNRMLRKLGYSPKVRRALFRLYAY